MAQLTATINPLDVATTKKAAWLSHLQPHSVFLILAVTFGLAVLIANPPFQAPDENDHFLRAYHISEGGFVGRKFQNNAGGELPLLAFRVTEMGEIPFHADKKMTMAVFREKMTPAFINMDEAPRVFVGFHHTVYTPPGGYIPQALAIFLGRLGHVGPLGLMYLARLAVLATSIALGHAALRVMPVFRWSCLLLLLVPMSLYLMGSVAPDGVLIGGAFLLMAFLLGYGTGVTRPLDRRTQVLILLLALLAALSKPIYLPLALLAPLFLLPRLSTSRDRTIFAVAFVMVVLAPMWGWGRIIASIYIPGRADIAIDPIAQWHYVMGDPLGFVALMLNSIRVEFDGIYRWFVGTLGWGDTSLPNWFYGTFGWGLLACLVVESSDAVRVLWWQRAALFAAAVVSTVMIFGAQYASWNAPGSRTPIEGIEGRYFLPIAAFVIAGFPPVVRRQAPAWLAPLLATALATTGAVACLRAVILRFYFS